jgi:hypothetical protein
MALTEKEALDALKFLGIENTDDMNMDKFKESVRSKYYTGDEIFSRYAVENKATFNGKVFGSAQTKIKKNFEELGVEFEDGELKDLMLEDMVKLGNTKLLGKVDSIKAEIEKQAGLTIDQRISEKEAELGKYKSKVSDYEKLIKQKATDFENKENEYKGQLKNSEINFHKKSVIGSLNYLPDLDSYKKKGFLAEMDERFNVDLDETGTPIPLDRKTGSRIPSDKTHGTFLSLDELYAIEAAKAGVISVTPQGGKKVEPKTTFTPRTAGGQQPAPVNGVARNKYGRERQAT